MRSMLALAGASIIARMAWAMSSARHILVRSKVDSAEAIAEADRLVPKLKALGFVVGPSPGSPAVTPPVKGKAAEAKPKEKDKDKDEAGGKKKKK